MSAMDFALAGSNRLIESVDGIVILEIERDPRRMELAEKSGRISLWESKTTGERVLYLTIRGTPELSYHGYETDMWRSVGCPDEYMYRVATPAGDGGHVIILRPRDGDEAAAQALQVLFAESRRRGAGPSGGDGATSGAGPARRSGSLPSGGGASNVGAMPAPFLAPSPGRTLLRLQGELEDISRVAAFRACLFENAIDLVDKTVLCVGPASCLIGLFAAAAGARLALVVGGGGGGGGGGGVGGVSGGALGAVGGGAGGLGASLPASLSPLLCNSHAVNVSRWSRALAAGNPAVGSRVRIVETRVEDLRLRERVDAIVWDIAGVPVSLSALEAYASARDRLLKPGGRLFPSALRLCAAAVDDAAGHARLRSRANFWRERDYFGASLVALAPAASAARFARPVVSPPPPLGTAVTTASHADVDLRTASPATLRSLAVPLSLQAIARSPKRAHAIEVWTELLLAGSVSARWLSAGPQGAQGQGRGRCTLYLERPIVLPRPGCTVSGELRLVFEPQQTCNAFLAIRGPALGGPTPVAPVRRASPAAAAERGATQGHATGFKVQGHGHDDPSRGKRDVAKEATADAPVAARPPSEAAETRDAANAEMGKAQATLADPTGPAGLVDPAGLAGLVDPAGPAGLVDPAGPAGSAGSAGGSAPQGPRATAGSAPQTAQTAGGSTLQAARSASGSPLEGARASAAQRPHAQRGQNDQIVFERFDLDDPIGADPDDVAAFVLAQNVAGPGATTPQAAWAANVPAQAYGVPPPAAYGYPGASYGVPGYAASYGAPGYAAPHGTPGYAASHGAPPPSSGARQVGWSADLRWQGGYGGGDHGGGGGGGAGGTGGSARGTTFPGMASLASSLPSTAQIGASIARPASTPTLAPGDWAQARSTSPATAAAAAAAPPAARPFRRSASETNLNGGIAAAAAGGGAGQPCALGTSATTATTGGTATTATTATLAVGEAASDAQPEGGVAQALSSSNDGGATGDADGDDVMAVEKETDTR